MPTPPAMCITPQEGKSLCDQWNSTRAQYIQSREGYQDACEFNMSIADLEAYLDYVKSESAAQGISNPGVRVYFAAYRTGAQPKATLMLCPTVNGTIDADNNYSIMPANRLGGRVPPKMYTP